MKVKFRQWWSTISTK